VAAASGPVGQEMRRSHPDIVLRVHVDVPQNLITHVAAGLVDIAIMYAPQHRLGLEIDLLMEEELVLVTTDLTTYDANDPRYVHVEWRPDFSIHHTASFPDTTPSLVANLGPWRSIIFIVGGWFWLLPKACGSAPSGIGKTSSGSRRPSLLFSDLRDAFNECRCCNTGCGAYHLARSC
jgi:DNA-binding transcriptional LysR family regulator